MARPQPKAERGIKRRAFLKTGTAVAGGVLVTGAASGTTSPNTESKALTLETGSSIEVGEGTVAAYATTYSAEGPDRDTATSLGVHVDGAAMEAFGDEEVVAPLDFPSRAGGSAMDHHQFAFLKFEYLPEGHFPEGVYDVPHLDIEFHMLDRSTVEGIEEGPANYSVPEAQMPEGHVRTPMVDADDDGEPDAPLVEAGRGEPIADPSASEFREDGEFTHTHVYGAYDPEGDGAGRLTLFEPMVALDFADRLDRLVVTKLRTPSRFHADDQYPTSYVLQPLGDGGMFVYLDDFESFPK